MIDEIFDTDSILEVSEAFAPNALVGGASLKPDFLAIVQAAAQ